MGRTPKPTEAKRLAGNPGKRNLPVPAATVPGVDQIPRAPAGLETAGRRFWRDIWTAGRVWLSPQLDAATVELAARTFDEIGRYRKALAAGPLLREPIVSASGKVVGERFVPNPAEVMLRRAERQLERWLIVLAIPPTARATLGLIEVRAQSGLEELLRQRNQPQTVELEVIDAEVIDDSDD